MRPMLICLLICAVFNAPNPRAIPMRPNLQANGYTYSTFPISSDSIPPVLIFFALMLACCSFCCNRLNVRYVSFDTDLSTLRKPFKGRKTGTYLQLIFLGLLMNDSPYDITAALIVDLLLIHVPMDLYPFITELSDHRKLLYQIYPFVTCLQLLLSAVCPESHFLCLFIIFTTCTFITKKVPLWVSLLLILLSNDIEMNPGPSYCENFFSFMNWNLNSLAKDNFQRVQSIEAHNTLFNYDLISICETSLNSSIEIPDPLLNDYTFLSANHPDNVSHGGVGLFYKNSLPLKQRLDLSFEESIVVELKFGRKKIFFTVLYRSPSIKHGSQGFKDFLDNFNSLHSSIQSENPFGVFYTGDFNGHSELWWSKGNTTPEGKSIEELLTSLNLSQVISEPTNFTPNKNPSCIDLLVTDQPNLILDSGTRPSLDPLCHHQIVYGKINLKIPPPPPVERKI